MSYFDTMPFEAGHELIYELAVLRATVQRCKDAIGEWAVYEGEGYLNGSEVIVLRIGVSVPSRSPFGILKEERIAIGCSDAAHRLLKAYALRKDFPRLPHINLVPKGSPVELCLFDVPFMDAMYKESMIGYIERVKHWLDRAAVGELHQDEQGMEPFLLNTVGDIVIDSDVELKIVQNRSGVFYAPKLMVEPGERNRRLYLELSPHQAENRENHFILFHIKGKSTASQCINYSPVNYTELADLIEEKLSISLDQEIYALFRILHGSKEGLRHYKDRSIILMICIPRLSSIGKVSGHEIVAFHIIASLMDLGKALGIIGEVRKKKREPVIVLLNEVKGERSELAKVLTLPFSVVRPLTKKLANEMAGINPETTSVSFCAIGMGALGSQVVMNLARQGFSSWSLIDNDILLPHNFARHALSALYRGNSKALSIKREIEFLLENVNPRHSYDELRNLLHNKDEGIFGASIILDFTASYSVFLDLAYLATERPRVLSSYMCGGGSASVLLSERPDRTVRLDDVDLQLKILALENVSVRTIYKTLQRKQLTYSLSCSSRTTVMAQDFVAIHSGLIARQIKAAISDSNGRCYVNLIQDDGFGVHVEEFIPSPVEIHESCGWQLRITQSALDEMKQFRYEKLPNETGGILIGWINSFRKLIYVGKALPAPPDSEERPYYFRRGKQGLHTKVQEIQRSSNGDLYFVGEWHSHPPFSSISQSGDDLNAMATLSRCMLENSLPGVMIILGDSGKIGCYVDCGWKKK